LDDYSDLNELQINNNEIIKEESKKTLNSTTSLLTANTLTQPQYNPSNRDGTVGKYTKLWSG
jgi:hypothetical protein